MTLRTPAPVRRWPLAVIAAPAAVSIWSGWVGLGGLCGFGVVQPLPGILQLHINTALTLPLGIESYAALALGAWLRPGTVGTARTFARWSALGSLSLGISGRSHITCWPPVTRPAPRCGRGARVVPAGRRARLRGRAAAPAQRGRAARTDRTRAAPGDRTRGKRESATERTRQPRPYPLAEARPERARRWRRRRTRVHVRACLGSAPVNPPDPSPAARRPGPGEAAPRAPGGASQRLNCPGPERLLERRSAARTRASGCPAASASATGCNPASQSRVTSPWFAAGGRGDAAARPWRGTTASRILTTCRGDGRGAGLRRRRSWLA